MGKRMRARWLGFCTKIDWQFIRDIHRKKSVIVASVFLFLIPLGSDLFPVARGLLECENSTRFICAYLPPANPFSGLTFKIFFVGAAFILLSRVLFALRCPSFIKKFDEHAAECFAGRETDLVLDLRGIIQDHGTEIGSADLIASLNSLSKTLGTPLSQNQLKKLKQDPRQIDRALQGWTVGAAQRGETFRAIFELVDRIRLGSRITYLVLLVVGGLMLSHGAIMRTYTYAKVVFFS